MASELPDELRELAWFQDGLLTGRQAVAGGLSREAVKWRLGTGQWQRMQTGVYAVFSGPPDRRAILWAVVLRAGPGAMLSYHTAAELAGLIDRSRPVIHVTLPVDRAVKPIPGVVLHRSGRAAQALHPVLAPPRTRVEETVLDLAGTAATLDDAYGWITRALGRRLTTQAPGGPAAASTGTCSTRSTPSPWSWTAAPRTRTTGAGPTSAATMRRLPTASSPSGTAGWMSPGSPAWSRPRWRRCSGFAATPEPGGAPRPARYPPWS
jgi:hypothetical protein